MRFRLSAVLALAVGLGSPGTPAAGQFTLFEKGDRSLTLGGYVRSLTQFYDPGYDIPGIEDREAGIHGEVIRLKWNLRLSESVLFELHNRLQGQVTSSEAGLGQSTVGFGVSVVPGRRWDLRARIPPDHERRDRRVRRRRRLRQPRALALGRLGGKDLGGRATVATRCRGLVRQSGGTPELGNRPAETGSVDRGFPGTREGGRVAA